MAKNEVKEKPTEVVSKPEIIPEKVISVPSIPNVIPANPIEREKTRSRFDMVLNHLGTFELTV